MTPFTYAKPADIERALGLAGPESRYIASGTNLLDPTRENIVGSRRFIGVTGLPLCGICRVPTGGLLVGALVSDTELAWNPAVEADYPSLTQAILVGTSPQLRNMTSTGDNLLQRTRYQYFYGTGTPCNKCEPGSGCPARNGPNRNHAILGTSEHCMTVHPSDLCMALAALEAQVLVHGYASERQIAFTDLRRLPADMPECDNCLAVDELVIAIELPTPRFARHCRYLKVRGRTSYALALVSVATALEPDGERIGGLRLALSGVTRKPWRITELKERFRGHLADRDSYVRFTRALLRDAKPLTHSAFKIGLARNVIVRVLEEAHSGGIGQRVACHTAPGKPWITSTGQPKSPAGLATPPNTLPPTCSTAA